MHEVQQERSAAVAIAATATAAAVVATMLEAHGLRAWTEAYASIYPSVEWVEGYRVRVADAHRDEAIRVLRALDRGDAVAL